MYFFFLSCVLQMASTVIQLERSQNIEHISIFSHKWRGYTSVTDLHFIKSALQWSIKWNIFSTAVLVSSKYIS